MLFLPESPRFLMHKNKQLEAYKVWKRIRGIDTREAREEFYVMSAAVNQEDTEVNEGAQNHRFPWMDFFTYVYSCLYLKAMKLISLQCPSRPTCPCLRQHHDSSWSAYRCQRY